VKAAILIGRRLTEELQRHGEYWIMKRSLIASFAALSLVAAPAVAATVAKGPATNAQVKKSAKHAKVAGAKVTKAAAKTAKKTS
jgi:hypothetical protein